MCLKPAGWIHLFASVLSTDSYCLILTGIQLLILRYGHLVIRHLMLGFA